MNRFDKKYVHFNYTPTDTWREQTYNISTKEKKLLQECTVLKCSVTLKWTNNNFSTNSYSQISINVTARISDLLKLQPQRTIEFLSFIWSLTDDIWKKNNLKTKEIWSVKVVGNLFAYKLKKSIPDIVITVSL